MGWVMHKLSRLTKNVNLMFSENSQSGKEDFLLHTTSKRCYRLKDRKHDFCDMFS